VAKKQALRRTASRGNDAFAGRAGLADDQSI